MELPPERPPAPPARPTAVQPAGGGAVSEVEAAEKALEGLEARYLAGELARDPVHATEAGDHAHDGKWPDLSEQGEAEARAFVEGTLKELAAIPRERLGAQARVDAAILENQLRKALFLQREVRELSWNPVAYTSTIGDGLDPLLTRGFAPLEVRMKSLKGRLDGIPGLVAVAKKRLGRPPRVHTETAIQQNKGLVALCKGELAPGMAALPAAQRAEVEASAKAAAVALEELLGFLEKELLPRSDGSFRLGRARFEKKLRFYLDDPVDVDAVAKGARELLARTQGEMAETAKELWPTLMGKKPLPPAKTPGEQKALVKAVLDKLAEERPTNATIVSEAKALLADATAFVRQHDLVRLPDEPCGVIEMPEYRRGVAIAYCDASGPLEQKPETFFAIAPTPGEWPRPRVESFYREYNRSMLADLVVHEAMPGHFLQLMHNNRFPSKLRAVLSSGPFVEGWAVYTEWLMAKYGFGGPAVRMQRQKMVLRLAANAILDHGVHAGTMDEKEGLALMRDEAFQEEGEAVGKWRRAMLTSAQLTTYYYGFTEMMRLRAEHEVKAGFSERAYHDRLLSHGSPPMRHLRALMAQER